MKRSNHCWINLVTLTLFSPSGENEVICRTKALFIAKFDTNSQLVSTKTYDNHQAVFRLFCSSVVVLINLT